MKIVNKTILFSLLPAAAASSFRHSVHSSSDSNDELEHAAVMLKGTEAKVVEALKVSKHKKDDDDVTPWTPHWDPDKKPGDMMCKHLGGSEAACDTPPLSIVCEWDTENEECKFNMNAESFCGGAADEEECNVMEYVGCQWCPDAYPASVCIGREKECPTSSATSVL